MISKGTRAFFSVVHRNNFLYKSICEFICAKKEKMYVCISLTINVYIDIYISMHNQFDFLRLNKNKESIDTLTTNEGKKINLESCLSAPPQKSALLGYPLCV